MEASTPITDFYRDKTIFVTGATGFVGKALLEKILRCCLGVKKIFILMRIKDQQSAAQRTEELLRNQVFDRVCEEALLKVEGLEGDISLPDFGLNSYDLQRLIQQVSIFFHSAATVKFDDPLRVSVQINLMGAKHALEIAKQMEHLESFVHVSTAYCNCDRDEIEEIIYPPPMPPQLIIDTIKWIEDPLLDSITPSLIKGRPNTYTFTKSLAENLLVENRGQLPLAIIRPSIITAAWREPYRGWIDNLNGPTGLYLATSQGILRTMLIKPDVKADYIPVDVVINLMLTVAWYRAKQNQLDTVLIYNCTSGTVNSMTWRTMESVTLPVILANPSTQVYRYPRYQSTPNRWRLWFITLIQHYLPASLIDAYSLIRGKKPRMMRLYQRIHKAVNTLKFFTMHEWKFDMTNTLSLMEKMSPEDLKMFNFDIRSLVWHEYMSNYVLGIRKYLMKEEESTLPDARKKLRSLYLKTQIIHMAAWIVLLRIAIHFSPSFRRFWYTMVSYALRLFANLKIFTL